MTHRLHHRLLTPLVSLLQPGSVRSQFYIISPKYGIQAAVQVSNSSGYSDTTGLLSSFRKFHYWDLFLMACFARNLRIISPKYDTPPTPQVGNSTA